MQDQDEDATRLSSRVAQDDATRLSSRGVSQPEVVTDGDDATRLSSRVAQDDATQLSSRMGGGYFSDFTGMDIEGGAPASEIGVSTATVAYDPESDGIVLTTYEPRLVESVLVIQPAPETTGPALGVDFGAVVAQAEIEQRYERVTGRWLAATAAVGLAVFGASVAGVVILLQGF